MCCGQASLCPYHTKVCMHVFAKFYVESFQYATFKLGKFTFFKALFVSNSDTQVYNTEV